MIDILAIHLADGVALTTDNTLCPITNMFDEFGEDTSDPAEARAIVIRVAEDCWLSAPCSAFQTAIIN